MRLTYTAVVASAGFAFAVSPSEGQSFNTLTTLDGSSASGTLPPLEIVTTLGNPAPSSISLDAPSAAKLDTTNLEEPSPTATLNLDDASTLAGPLTSGTFSIISTLTGQPSERTLMPIYFGDSTVSLPKDTSGLSIVGTVSLPSASVSASQVISTDSVGASGASTTIQVVGTIADDRAGAFSVLTTLTGDVAVASSVAGWTGLAAPSGPESVSIDTGSSNPTNTQSVPDSHVTKPTVTGFVKGPDAVGPAGTGPDTLLTLASGKSIPAGISIASSDSNIDLSPKSSNGAGPQTASPSGTPLVPAKGERPNNKAAPTSSSLLSLTSASAFLPPASDGARRVDSSARSSVSSEPFGPSETESSVPETKAPTPSTSNSVSTVTTSIISTASLASFEPESMGLSIFEAEGFGRLTTEVTVPVSASEHIVTTTIYDESQGEKTVTTTLPGVLVTIPETVKTLRGDHVVTTTLPAVVTTQQAETFVSVLQHDGTVTRELPASTITLPGDTVTETLNKDHTLTSVLPASTATLTPERVTTTIENDKTVVSTLAPVTAVLPGTTVYSTVDRDHTFISTLPAVTTTLPPVISTTTAELDHDETVTITKSGQVSVEPAKVLIKTVSSDHSTTVTLPAVTTTLTPEQRTRTEERDHTIVSTVPAVTTTLPASTIVNTSDHNETEVVTSTLLASTTTLPEHTTTRTVQHLRKVMVTQPVSVRTVTSEHEHDKTIVSTLKESTATLTLNHNQTRTTTVQGSATTQTLEFNRTVTSTAQGSVITKVVNHNITSLPSRHVSYSTHDSDYWKHTLTILNDRNRTITTTIPHDNLAKEEQVFEDTGYYDFAKYMKAVTPCVISGATQMCNNPNAPPFNAEATSNEPTQHATDIHKANRIAPCVENGMTGYCLHKPTAVSTLLTSNVTATSHPQFTNNTVHATPTPTADETVILHTTVYACHTCPGGKGTATVPVTLHPSGTPTTSANQTYSQSSAHYPNVAAPGEMTTKTLTLTSTTCPVTYSVATHGNYTYSVPVTKTTEITYETTTVCPKTRKFPTLSIPGVKPTASANATATHPIVYVNSTSVATATSVEVPGVSETTVVVQRTETVNSCPVTPTTQVFTIQTTQSGTIKTIESSTVKSVPVPLPSLSSAVPSVPTVPPSVPATQPGPFVNSTVPVAPPGSVLPPGSVAPPPAVETTPVVPGQQPPTTPLAPPVQGQPQSTIVPAPPVATPGVVPPPVQSETPPAAASGVPSVPTVPEASALASPPAPVPVPESPAAPSAPGAAPPAVSTPTSDFIAPPRPAPEAPNALPVPAASASVVPAPPAVPAESAIVVPAPPAVPAEIASVVPAPPAIPASIASEAPPGPSAGTATAVASVPAAPAATPTQLTTNGAAATRPSQNVGAFLAFAIAVLAGLSI